MDDRREMYEKLSKDALVTLCTLKDLLVTETLEKLEECQGLGSDSDLD